MSITQGKLTISFHKKLFSCVNCISCSVVSSVSYITNQISHWRLNDCQPISWHWSLSMSSEKTKTPVPWNGLKIFLTNMSAECWYSCLFHNSMLFYSRSGLKRYQVSMFSDFGWFHGTPLNDHGNQLKQ